MTLPHPGEGTRLELRLEATAPVEFPMWKVGIRQDHWDHVASSHNISQTLLICEWHEFQKKKLDLALLWFELMRGTWGASFSIWKMKACALENVLAFPLPMFSRRSRGKVSRLHLSVPLEAPESSHSLITRYLKTSAPGIFSFFFPARNHCPSNSQSGRHEFPILNV